MTNLYGLNSRLLYLQLDSPLPYGTQALYLSYTYRGRPAFANFMQLAMISFAHFLRILLRTIFTPQSEATLEHTCTGNRTGEMRTCVFVLSFLNMEHEMYSQNNAFLSLQLFHSHFYTCICF